MTLYAADSKMGSMVKLDVPLVLAPLPVLRGMRGASFTEMLVVLLVIGVCSAMVLPSLSHVMRTKRIEGQVNAMLIGLHSARSEAIKRNARVVLCKSPDGVMCTNMGGWEQGWILFQDANNNAVREPDETLISSHGTVENMRITGDSSVGRYVSYSGTGTAKMVSGAFQAGSFTVCASAQWELAATRIILSPTGRARVAQGSEGSC